MSSRTFSRPWAVPASLTKVHTHSHAFLKQDDPILGTEHRITEQISPIQQHVARSHGPALRRPAQPRPINAASQQVAESSNTSDNGDRLGRRAKEKMLDKEFFLSLLSSASTKREAKSYLSRLKATAAKEDALSNRTTTSISHTHGPKSTQDPSSSSEVNSGSFYDAPRAVHDTPVFRQEKTPVSREQGASGQLNLALIKLSTPQELDNETVDGVAKTLSQLVRLGMACCVVVDPGWNKDENAQMRSVASEQATRLANAVDAQPDSKSFCLDSILSLSETDPGLMTVTSRQRLLRPLRDGHVVVITPIAYSDETPRAIPVSANEAILTLTREFAGLSMTSSPDEDPTVTAEKVNALQREVSVDRVILLHPSGGIPAFRGPQESHVFINMEQEFEDIATELSAAQRMFAGAARGPVHPETKSALEFSGEESISKLHHSPHTVGQVLDGHLDNLRLSQQTLAMLPSTSSGIITSPYEVAKSARPREVNSNLSAVGTRRQRNPLIHNLLTDKPLLSSSLPPGRRKTINHASTVSAPSSHSTFVKRGMPLTMLPNPYVQMWTAHSQPRLKLDDPSIDLPRLVHLIEDSFGRKLDVRDYLERVNDRLAGLIIAGEYEGGAILTWEAPPGVVDDGSEASAARMVPYLDKFAVLKRSQGAGGVADVVFNAMVRTCFPNGVCWRSRKDNPVNKWYFERSIGTWKLSDSNWTMFWTTPGLVDNPQRFRDYENVCRNIQPSWADHSNVVD
ncbi:Amino-acid acetyltransferase [Penicillium oxalicum]|uniref:Amino-acid acetyltransferase n=1 Tax=Penicillium oxalicum TaxID=69781 RepID=UPI0020B86BA3|nr:Amino-acid acetyltransferase [Penicillium oxalicum]KAI2789130.1 Amino-acid acetyltransferase [Penicillium oxalicum]